MVKEALAVAGGLVTAPFVVVVVVVSLDGTQPIMLMLMLYDSMNIKMNSTTWW